MPRTGATIGRILKCHGVWHLRIWHLRRNEHYSQCGRHTHIIGKSVMSFIYGLVLIAIAWALSTLVDGLANVGTLLSSLPTWLGLIAIAGILSWLIGEP